ncbi:UNVERIFIED_CONTAM: hypothetical protein FKN15_072159 [Acipenser sinensis]
MRPVVSHTANDKMDVSVSVSFFQDELASTIEHAVKAAVDTVLCEITKVVGSKFTEFQMEMAESAKENSNLKLKLQRYMEAAERSVTKRDPADFRQENNNNAAGSGAGLSRSSPASLFGEPAVDPAAAHGVLDPPPCCFQSKREHTVQAMRGRPEHASGAQLDLSKSSRDVLAGFQQCGHGVEEWEGDCGVKVRDPVELSHPGPKLLKESVSELESVLKDDEIEPMYITADGIYSKPLLCLHGLNYCVECQESYLTSLHQGAAAEKPHQCPDCGKRFKQPGHLKTHRQVHSSAEKIFSCGDCGKSFNQLVKLRQHQRIHTGEKPYQCSECGKSFSRLDKLKQHHRIHTGESKEAVITESCVRFWSLQYRAARFDPSTASRNMKIVLSELNGNGNYSSQHASALAGTGRDDGSCSSFTISEAADKPNILKLNTWELWFFIEVGEGGQLAL